MALTYHIEESDGVKTLFPVHFAYLSQSDVYVYAGDHGDYAKQVSYRWANSSTIELMDLTQVPAGTKFTIRRVMDRTALIHTFANKGIRGAAVDKENYHALYLVQEISDGFRDDSLDLPQIIKLRKEIQDGDAASLTELIEGDAQLLGGRTWPPKPSEVAKVGDKLTGVDFLRIKHWATTHIYRAPSRLTGTINGISGAGAKVSVTVDGTTHTVYKVTRAVFESNKAAALSSLSAGMLVDTYGFNRLGDRGIKNYVVKTPSEYIGKTSTYGDITLANGNILVELPVHPEPREVKLFAHRGGMRDVCEATMVAYQNSLSAGADGFSTELGCSSDGVWFVYHGSDLSRLTTGTGNIYDKTAAYIESLSFKALAGTRYESTVKIPRLDNLLHFIEKTGVTITCEIANARPSHVNADKQAAINKIAASPARKNVFIEVTVDADALRVRNTSTELSMSWSFASSWKNPAELYGVAAYRNMCIRVSSDWVNTPIAQEAISTARALGLDIFCYTTANNAEDIEKVLSAGIYNIITDRGWE